MIIESAAWRRADACGMSGQAAGASCRVWVSTLGRIWQRGRRVRGCRRTGWRRRHWLVGHQPGGVPRASSAGWSWHVGAPALGACRGIGRLPGFRRLGIAVQPARYSDSGGSTGPRGMPGQRALGACRGSPGQGQWFCPRDMPGQGQYSVSGHPF